VTGRDHRGQRVAYDQHGLRYPELPAYRGSLAATYHLCPDPVAHEVPPQHPEDAVVPALDPISHYHSGTAPPPSDLELEAALRPEVRL
jgi:hypothetical protein